MLVTATILGSEFTAWLECPVGVLSTVEDKTEVVPIEHVVSSIVLQESSPRACIRRYYDDGR